MSNTSRRFFQFSVNMLSLATPVDEVSEDGKKRAMSRIVHYAMADVFDRLLVKYDEATLYAMAEVGHQYQEVDFDLDDFDDVVTLATLKTLNVVAGGRNRKQWQKVRRDTDKLHFGKALVRVSNDVFWDALESWSWRDFAVLCAINSCIGNSSARIVRHNLIHARTVGCSSLAEVNANRVRRFFLSERQLKHTINKLMKRNFFVKNSANFRDWYYSRTLSEPALAAHISKATLAKSHTSLADKSKALRKQIEQAKADETRRRDNQQALAALAATERGGAPPQTPHAGSNQRHQNRVPFVSASGSAPVSR